MVNKSKFLIETNEDNVILQVQGDTSLLIASIASALCSDRGDEILEIITSAVLLSVETKEKKKKKKK